MVNHCTFWSIFATFASFFWFSLFSSSNTRYVNDVRQDRVGDWWLWLSCRIIVLISWSRSESESLRERNNMNQTWTWTGDWQYFTTPWFSLFQFRPGLCRESRRWERARGAGRSWSAWRTGAPPPASPGGGSTPRWGTESQSISYLITIHPDLLGSLQLFPILFSLLTFA